MDQKTSLFKYQITTVIQSIFSNDNDILLGINSMENYEKIHVLKFFKRFCLYYDFYIFFSFSFPFFFFSPKNFCLPLGFVDVDKKEWCAFSLPSS